MNLQQLFFFIIVIVSTRSGIIKKKENVESYNYELDVLLFKKEEIHFS